MRYRLRDAAAADYIGIYTTGVQRFGIRPAEAYLNRLDAVLLLIAEQPRMGRVRPEITGSPRAHHLGVHVILWDIAKDGTAEILRIRHQHEDWLPSEESSSDAD